jgi:hypothetical protein
MQSQKSDLNSSESAQNFNQDHFQADTPLNEVLNKMISRMALGKMYNPAAKYVRNRKIIVDWMCVEAENLGY